MTVELYLGDCLEVMKNLDDNSVDSVITDSPYGLEFMGKDWDKGVPGIAFWKEILRVAKPGAILMAFGGTRTVHRLACAIEDAGWEIRDRMQWLNGQGFPKSHSISKAMDKKAGAKRKVVGEYNVPGYARTEVKQEKQNRNKYKFEKTSDEPATEEAKLWDGWGTALKPAHEPIIVAMKPIEGTYVENALKWGVAGLWIDGARVEAGNKDDYGRSVANAQGIRVKGGANTYGEYADTVPEYANSQGRWPANVLHDGSDEVLAGFPHSKSGAMKKSYEYKNNGFSLGAPSGSTRQIHESSSGSAARFFYCAKASKKERNAGLEGMEEKTRRTMGKGLKGKSGDRTGDGEYMEIRMGENKMQNHHPTVKPLALMRYLCRLTKTPTGGIVLDPFMGSGTTGMAAVLEGRDFIGIELDEEYFQIAKKRIAHAKESDG